MWPEPAGAESGCNTLGFCRASLEIPLEIGQEFSTCAKRYKHTYRSERKLDMECGRELHFDITAHFNFEWIFWRDKVTG
jgi:hypothetical protein